MNKLVIFDLDGTLLHTLPDIVESVNDTMRKFSFEELSYKKIMTFIGNGAKVLIERCLSADVGEEKFNEILSYYNKIYTNSDSANTRVFDGLDKVLKSLKKDGYKIAILTNKPMMTTEKVYDKYLKQYDFDMVVGASDKIKCKPDKEAALYIMNKLGADKNSTIMVGDGDTDAMLANNAEIFGISVLWGYREQDKLKQAGAKQFASTPDELYKIITSR